MCGGQVFVDPDGQRENFSLRPGGGGGTRRESWDCVNAICVKRNNDNGQFATQADCERDCLTRGWNFIPCVGCVESDTGWGEYETKEDCEQSNPDPFDAAYNCSSGESGPASAPDPVSDNRDYECVGVSCGGVGSGEFFIGFIRRIRVTEQGTVIIAECSEYEFKEAKGFTGWVSFMVDVDIDIFSGFHTIYYNKARFQNGLLMEVAAVPTAGSFWVPGTPDAFCLVTKSCCL